MIINSPPAQSQQSPQEIQKSQPKKPVATELHQSIPSQQNNKRKKSSSNIIGFDTLDEDGNVDSCIIIIIKTKFSVR